MKKRISATIESETFKLVEKLVKKGFYRNKSHVIEEAIKNLHSENNKKIK